MVHVGYNDESSNNCTAEKVTYHHEIITTLETNGKEAVGDVGIEFKLVY